MFSCNTQITNVDENEMHWFEAKYRATVTLGVAFVNDHKSVLFVCADPQSSTWLGLSMWSKVLLVSQTMNLMHCWDDKLIASHSPWRAHSGHKYFVVAISLCFAKLTQHSICWFGYPSLRCSYTLLSRWWHLYAIRLLRV